MILDDIVKAKQKRLVMHKEKCSFEKMKQKALASKRESISFYDAMRKPGLSIIGEFKKASPSMGVIDGKIPLKERISDYNQSVDAISCLTEEDYFNGSTAYLEEIRKISGLPIIRKDFIVDSYQIYEAKVIEADCILLIVAILSEEQLKEYYQLAESLKLNVLVEVHDEEEMEKALKIGPKMIGVNNRNLKDFTISLDNTSRLRPMVPKDTIFVSESGVTTLEDIYLLKECEVDALLMGRALMESENPKEVAQQMKAAYI